MEASASKLSAGFVRKFLLLGFTLVLLLLAASTGLSQANEDSWTSDSQLYIRADPNTKVGLNKKNTDCYNRQLTTLTNPGVNEPLEPKQIEKCVLSTPAGIFGGGYVQPDTLYAYKVLPAGGPNLVGIPNSTKYLQLYGGGGYNTVSLLDSLQTNGSFEVENSNIYRGNTYKPEVKTETFIKDINGTPLNIEEYAFSTNGQWMVAEVPWYGLVRINVDTGHTTLFYAITLNTSISPALAISNDGRFASLSGFGVVPPQLFDISTCEVQDSFSLTIKDDSGCSTRTLSSEMHEADSDFAYLSGLRFAPDGRTITGTIITHRDTPGFDTSKVTLSLDAISEDQTSYLAMGDSFASGEGDSDASWYAEGTNEQDVNLCHLSKRSYPYLIASDLNIAEFHNVACSGAKQEHITNEIQQKSSTGNTPFGEWTPGFRKQIDYVDKDKTPSFLTVTVGGNDVGFILRLVECLLPGTCKYAQNRSDRNLLAKEIAYQYDGLRDTYRQLVQATDKNTKIFVAGYPEFIQGSGGSCGTNVLLNDAEREFISRSTAYVNRVIKAAAESEGVYFVDVESALDGRNLCSGADRDLVAVNGVTLGDDIQTPWYANYTAGSIVPFGSSSIKPLFENVGIGNESFHPNQIGHQLLRDEIIQHLGNPADFPVCKNPDEKICPDSAAAVPEPDPNYFGSLDDIYQPSIWRPQELGGELIKINRLSIQVDLGDLLSKSFVHAELHSTPVSLGSFQVTDDGNASMDLDIPKDTEPGYHELHFYGYNHAEEKMDYYLPIYLTGSDGDINSSGVPDEQESCGFVGDSGIDYDQDGVDDACDGSIGEPPEEPQGSNDSADIIGGVNPTNNSSDFLIQSGGGLQTQGSVPQGTISGLQNNESQLFSGSAGIGQQDILGQSTVVGPVEFDAGKVQATGQNQPQNSSGIDWGVSLVYAGLVFALVLFLLAARRIIRG